MHARVGGAPDLVLELEILGVGMETTGPWAAGGPFVWRRANGTRVVGWIRAVPKEEINRAGAVEAWGVQASSWATIGFWPFHWTLLQQEPTDEGLRQLADAFAQLPDSSTLPGMRSDYAGLLTEAWRHSNGDSFLIPLNSVEDLPTLAWFWLLGPVDPENATLCPPRRNLPALTEPLTYAGIIGAAMPRNLAASEYVVTNFFPGSKKVNPINAAASLRKLPTNDRLRLLQGGTKATKATRADFDREEALGGGGDMKPPVRKPAFTFAKGWRWPEILNLALQIMQLLLLLWIALRLLPPGPEKPPPSTTTAAATETSTTQVSTAGQTDTVGDYLPQQVHAALTVLLRTPREGITYAGSMRTLARAGAGTLPDVAHLRTAALQIYFIRRECAAADAKVDGEVGPAFYDGLKCVGKLPDGYEVLKSDRKLIDWLRASS